MFFASAIVVYTVVTAVSLDGWELVGTSSYFDCIDTGDEVNQTHVISTINTSSLQACLSTVIDLSGFTVKSLYYNTDNNICYRNDMANFLVVNANGAGVRYYCEITKSYEMESNVTDRRITVANVNYSSCQDVYDDGFRHAGVYEIQDPIGGSSFNYVPCNEGWIVFQRREDGSVDFYRGWDDYVNGFGDKAGEFWLGLETIHQMTSAGTCQLHIYLKAEDDHPVQTVGYAEYSHFSVTSSASNYTLIVSGFSGNVIDSFGHHNGYQFSTKDMDNDVASSECAKSYKGGWWYSACHGSNLNGLYLYGVHSSYADGIEWSRTWGYHYSLVKVEMRLRC